MADPHTPPALASTRPLLRFPLPQLIVDRSPHPCPYLQGRTAVLPMRLPMRRLTASDLDACLADGDRRQGVLLYRPDCGSCQACIPIRLDVAVFQPSAAQRRAERVGRQRLSVTLGPPRADAERVALYNLHKRGRGLDEPDEEEASERDYAAFLVESCADTWELAYHLDGRLVGIAVFDRSAHALSAVYCCYDPSVRGISIGVFSVMLQVALCRQWGLQYLYLGYYVPGCKAMRYKASFAPNQQLRDGQWLTGTA